VIFVGSAVNGNFDAGAIRIEATSESGTVTVTGGKVVIGSCTYEPWPGLNQTVAPGQNLILTQTGSEKRCSTSATAEQSNFDTSESVFQHQSTFKCTNDGLIPEVELTMNGQTVKLLDSGQVLNTGGTDPDICASATEFREWSQLQ
jgi:hypothetical protein